MGRSEASDKNSFDPLSGLRLGPLEQKVAEALWRLESATVREVLEEMDGEVAYTTLMTTMDRLYKKGLLVREMRGRAFVYRPALSQAEAKAGMARRLFAGLLHSSADTQPLLSYLVDAVSESDRELLDDLEELVRAKKESLK
jgi:predicted transcriptional regulator